MQSALKKSAPASPAPRPLLRDINDPAQLAAFVRFARADPRAAATILSDYLDWICANYEGCDISRTIDTWAYDPDDDSFDAMTWYAGPGRRLSPNVRIALRAVVAGVRTARRT